MLFFFLLIIDLYVFIPAAIAQAFYPIEEFIISRGMPSKEAIKEVDVHPVIAETEIRKSST